MQLAVDHFTFPHLFTSRAFHLSLSAVNYYFTRLNVVCKDLGHCILKGQYLYFMSHCALRTLL